MPRLHDAGDGQIRQKTEERRVISVPKNGLHAMIRRLVVCWYKPYNSKAVAFRFDFEFNGNTHRLKITESFLRKIDNRTSQLQSKRSLQKTRWKKEPKGRGLNANEPKFMFSFR